MGSPAEDARLVIERITVSGKGWFEGADAPFSEKLTSILGAKGTGKTTLLLFLAFVLEVPLTPKQLMTVKHNLGGGRVEVWVKVAHGTRYVLARALNARASVYNERHEPLKITVAGNDLFAVDFYSHDQVGSIADEPAEQLALLDRLAGEPMRALQAELGETRKALLEREGALLAMHGTKEQLENMAAEAAEISRELSAMAPKDGSAREEVQRAHGDRILRDREQRAVASADAAIAATRAALRAVVEGARAKLGSCIDADLLAGPNGAVLRPLESRLQSAADGIERAATAASGLLDDAAKSVVEQRDALTLAHAKQEHEHGLLMAKQNEESTTAARRIQLSARFAEVMTAPANLQLKAKEWGSAKAGHAALAMTYAESRARRSKLRWDTKEALAPRLHGDVRVFLKEDGSRAAYEQAIAEGLKDHVANHVKLGKKLAELPTEVLAALVEARDSEELHARAGVTQDTAAGILAGLGRLPHLLAIQSAEVDDLAEVQLAEGTAEDRTWKSSKEFSHGERVTAALPIVMFESNRPLIIDQPEDDLDNQYVYERVVQNGILTAKHLRQMIFATHSANVAVNGASEHQLVVTKAKKQGHVTLAKTLEAALKLLEGGKEALLARLRAYGL